MNHAFPIHNFSNCVASVLLVGCNSDSSSFDLNVAQGTVAKINAEDALETVSYDKNGEQSSLALTIGYGSGAYHAASDSVDVFYTISDRGPNIACDESEAVLGVSDLCGAGNDD